MLRLLIIIIPIILIGCSSNEKIINSGKLKPNLTKSELRDILLLSYIGDDPFLSDGGSAFIHDNNAEIIWGENRKMFYVFQYVSETVSCGLLSCRLGNGALKSWHKTFAEARASLPKKELTHTEKLNQQPSTTSTTNSSTSSSSNSGTYDETKYLICYGQMTKAHKARGFHQRNRAASIKVKETVCKAFAKGEIYDYEGKGL